MRSQTAGATARSLANTVSSSLDDVRGSDSIARARTNFSEITEEIAPKLDGRQLVRRVIDEFDIKDSTFADQGGCAASDLSNAFKNKQRFDLQWLLNQPREFLCCWLSEVESEMGLTPQRRRRIAAKAHLDRAFELTEREGR
jgi:hypothetical protein